MKTLEKQYGFYAFMSTESDMIGNPIRYDVEEGLNKDLTEKVAYDVGKIIDVLKSKVPFGQKWSNVVMLDTLKKSAIVQFDTATLKFVIIGELSSLLPSEFFADAENMAKYVRQEKKRYDDYLTTQIEEEKKRMKDKEVK